MARSRKVSTPVRQVVSVPLTVGTQVAFMYGGAIRFGRVEKITAKCVTLMDALRNDYRSFSLHKINS